MLTVSDVVEHSTYIMNQEAKRRGLVLPKVPVPPQ